MISKEFSLPRELATLAKQLHESQHYEAATLVIGRIEATLMDLEVSMQEQFKVLKIKLEAAEAKIPNEAIVIDGTQLVINCEAVDASTGPADIAAAPVEPVQEAAPTVV